MNNLATVENMNGILVVSSRAVAEQLGKEHKHVLRDIKEKSLSKFGQWIIPNKYKANNGQEYDEYLLTKDGFIMLVFNYEGYLEFKEAYIKKFNEMENKIRELEYKNLQIGFNQQLEELHTFIGNGEFYKFISNVHWLKLFFDFKKRSTKFEILKQLILISSKNNMRPKIIDRINYDCKEQLNNEYAFHVNIYNIFLEELKKDKDYTIMRRYRTNIPLSIILEKIYE